MRRSTPLVFAAALLAAADGAGAQEAPGPGMREARHSAGVPAVITLQPRIRAATVRIAERSPAFRDELQRVAALGRHVLVLTSEQVVLRGADDAGGRGFDDSQLAEAIPVPATDSVIRTVVVILNLSLLERLGSELGLPDPDIEDDIARILIHEVYAHAVPWLLDGSGCDDPRPGQEPEEACSIRRENTVRAEAGLGLRQDYGLGSLALGKRLRL